MDKSGYFNIIKYINSFEVSQDVLEHLAEVQEAFDVYLTKLLSLGDDAINYLMIELYNELLFSNQIEESRIIPPTDFLDNNLIVLGRYLTNRKICNIQKLLLRNHDVKFTTGEYRKTPVFIPTLNSNDQLSIYQAPDASVVPRFMQDYITFFNRNSDNLIDNDPFIKAALLHFLFVKIHPFRDGNGRTTRVLHNLKFTNLVNRTYSYKVPNLSLQVCPLNISYSIFNNKNTYYKKLGNIDFSENADINDSVNQWLHFLLCMYEEQLYYTEHSDKLTTISNTLKRARKK